MGRVNVNLGGVCEMGGVNLSGVSILGPVNITAPLELDDIENVEADSLADFIKWVTQNGNKSIAYNWNSISLIRNENGNWYISGPIQPNIKLN